MAAVTATVRDADPVPEKRYYMACLDLTGRDVLVVGAGSVALERSTACSTWARASRSSRRTSRRRWRRSPVNGASR